MSKQNIQNKLNKCANMFNTIIVDVGELIKKEFPNQFTEMYVSFLKSIAQEKPFEPISIFIKYVYMNDKYKKCLYDGDENFFLNFNDEYSFSEGESTLDQCVDMIFKFRNEWTRLSNDHKTYIKQCMKTLIDITDKYVIQKSKTF